MKKTLYGLRAVLSLLLVLTLLVLFCACGGGEPAETAETGHSDPPSAESQDHPVTDAPAAPFQPTAWETVEDTKGGNFLTSDEEDGVAIIAYLGLGDIVRIPESIGGRPVCRIAKAAFTRNKFITRIYIPDSVRVVDNEAFQHCAVLREVRWPCGTEILPGTFRDSAELRCVLLPDCPAIGDSAFSGCKNLTEISLPMNAETIGKEAFSQCQKLTAINASAAKQIGEKAFYGCSSLTKLTLASDVWYSADRLGYAFCGECRSLADFTLITTGGDAERRLESDHGILYLGERLICAAPGITDTEITVLNGTSVIAPGAFTGCWKLKNIRFPATRITLGHDAFAQCFALSTLEFPGGLQAEDGTSLYECFANSGVSTLIIEGEELTVIDLMSREP